MQDWTTNVTISLPIIHKLVAARRESASRQIPIDIGALAKRVPRTAFILLREVSVKLVAAGFHDHFHG